MLLVGYARLQYVHKPVDPVAPYRGDPKPSLENPGKPPLVTVPILGVVGGSSKAVLLLACDPGATASVLGVAECMPAASEIRSSYMRARQCTSSQSASAAAASVVARDIALSRPVHCAGRQAEPM